MKLKKLNQIRKINEQVAAAGEIILNPASSEGERVAAIARVDALGDRGASWAIRTYGDTVGLDPAGSDGQDKLKQLASLTGEDKALQSRLSAMKAYLQGE